MNTIELRAHAVAVTGARHLRGARNGQDAAASLVGDGFALVVVCDGCSSGGSSEVGARLGSRLFAGALGARLSRGERPSAEATWNGARGDVVRALAELLERLPGDRSAAIEELFLFTLVAAAATRDEAAVWALGDGAYSFGETTRVLGPFADNAPPYLAYDLLGEPQEAAFEVAPAGWASIVVGTDGACELDDGLARFAAAKYVAHPDALRRELAVLARSTERIDWDERRIVRVPAVLQDDCAIGVLHRRAV